MRHRPLLWQTAQVFDLISCSDVGLFICFHFSRFSHFYLLVCPNRSSNGGDTHQTEYICQRLCLLNKSAHEGVDGAYTWCSSWVRRIRPVCAWICQSVRHANRQRVSGMCRNCNNQLQGEMSWQFWLTSSLSGNKKWSTLGHRKIKVCTLQDLASSRISLAYVLYSHSFHCQRQAPLNKHYT